MDTGFQEEEQRLRALYELRILDTPPEPCFDELVALAADLFGAPIAFVSFIDRERQWFKSKTGTDLRETPRALSFCAHAIHGRDVFVVEDLSRHPVFTAHPLVRGPPGLRFYAGAPLLLPSGTGEVALGAVCVLDVKPRHFQPRDRGLLRALSKQAIFHLLCRLRGMVLDDELRREVSLRHRAQDQLAANRNRTRVVAHDLRQPLSAIELGIEVVQRGAPKTERRKHLAQLLDRVRRSSGLMRRELQDLLEEPSRSGLLPLAFSRVDLRDVVTTALGLFEARALTKGLRLEAHVPEQYLAASCDGERLVEALANLLDNGVRFTPPGGRVEVTLELHSEQFVFSVLDSGPGVSEESREHVFERGWSRGDAGGKGLGLYIARQVVEAHGGRIWVEASHGNGGCFRFVLPRRSSGTTVNA